MAGQSRRGARHRADEVRRQAQGRLDERPRPRGHRQGARGLRLDVRRHRRRRGRQGARLLRGRHDARAVHGRRRRRDRQAADPGAHRGLGRRVDRDRRGQPGAVRQVQARADDGLGEAVRVQCHVGVEHSGAVHQAGRRGRGRLLRPARAVLHPPLGRADAHRRDGRGEGPAQRRQEPAGPPASARHHAGEGDGVPDAVGSNPVRRDLPVVRRRLRAGDRQRGDRGSRASPTAIPWRGSTPPRCAPNRWPTPDATRSTRRPAATPSAALWRDAGITSPIDEIDVAEVYVPFSWFEPMWLENLGFAAEGEGWKLTEAGETAIGGRIPFNPSGGVLSSATRSARRA